MTTTSRIINDLTRGLHQFTPLLDYHLFDDVFNESNSGKRFPKSRYPMNYYIPEDTRDHVIEYALAGFKKENIKVEVDGDILKINAKRDGNTLEGAHILSGQISNAELNVEWKLPKNVNPSGTKVQFEDSILKLTIPTIIEQKAESKVLTIN